MAGGLSWLYAWETMALDGYVVALAKPDFTVTPTGGTVTISLRAAPDTAGHGSGLAVMPGSRGAGGYSRCEPCGPTPRAQRGGKQSRESKRACSAEGCWGPTSRGSILRPRLAGPGHGYNEFAVPMAEVKLKRTMCAQTKREIVNQGKGPGMGPGAFPGGGYGRPPFWTAARGPRDFSHLPKRAACHSLRREGGIV